MIREFRIVRPYICSSAAVSLRGALSLYSRPLSGVALELVPKSQNAISVLFIPYGGTGPTRKYSLAEPGSNRRRLRTHRGLRIYRTKGSEKANFSTEPNITQ